MTELQLELIKIYGITALSTQILILGTSSIKWLRGERFKGDLTLIQFILMLLVWASLWPLVATLCFLVHFFDKIMKTRKESIERIEREGREATEMAQRMELEREMKYLEERSKLSKFQEDKFRVNQEIQRIEINKKLEREKTRLAEELAETQMELEREKNRVEIAKVKAETSIRKERNKILLAQVKEEREAAKKIILEQEKLRKKNAKLGIVPSKEEKRIIDI